ncbi:MAG: DUF4145 domain-containing protein [Promethearchaeota archaeon]|jgi:hypothetical protein
MPLEEKYIYRPSSTDIDGRLDYNCGHCGRAVSGRVPNTYGNDRNNPSIRFSICPSCVKGSVWMNGIMIPGTNPGQNLEGLPNDVEAAYEEARKCFSIGAFTGCELLCRKILMHVGVDNGAQEGQSFVSYLNHLEQIGFITPPIKKWANLIRKFGNQSTHKLDPPDSKRSEGTLLFTMELLKIIYEMKFIANKFDPNP